MQKVYKDYLDGKDPVSKTSVFLTEKRQIQESMALTAGMITMIDDAVGKVRDALVASQLETKTVQIYTSDHGEQIGERDLWWKQTFYEESVKVPLIMSWKDVLPNNSRRKQIINLVDSILYNLN